VTSVVDEDKNTPEVRSSMLKVIVTAIISALAIVVPAWMSTNERVAAVETSEARHYNELINKIETSDRYDRERMESINEALREIRAELRNRR